MILLLILTRSLLVCCIVESFREKIKGSITRGSVLFQSQQIPGAYIEPVIFAFLSRFADFAILFTTLHTSHLTYLETKLLSVMVAMMLFRSKRHPSKNRINVCMSR
uniref:Secreted protein n=1 Tax=Cacopsylla melanoneura TaxID=428564 RepID=A0A8D8TT04_9HEMI